MGRYLPYASSVVLALLALVLAMRWPVWGWAAAVFGALALLGTWDLLQRRSTLRRNYPVLAHFRYGLESVGPEIRQYFIEAIPPRCLFRASSVRWFTSVPRA
jgi:hypothetical protein